jgi:hypothetical protein
LKEAHNGGQRNDEDGLDKWPLDLDGWWTAGQVPEAISLSWEDMKSADDLYEDTLLNALSEVQSCIVRAFPLLAFSLRWNYADFNQRRRKHLQPIL